MDQEGSTSSLARQYQVFLSFCGKDTRYGFTDFLYTLFDRAGIRTFRDDNELPIGEEIAAELIKAINESKISIPILSKNYASSKWCLSELAQMVKCMRSERQKIYPIFYEIEPSDVRHQSGCYDAAFIQHQMCFDEETVRGWKEALKIVGGLAGRVKKIDGPQGKLANEVLEEVLLELKMNHARLSDHCGNLAGESYINAAFRSSRSNEAYLFMKNEYVLVDYDPGTTNDKVLNGPLLIGDGYPSLRDTAFAEKGIDCAFGSHDKDEAFIFCENLCALINYAPHSADDKIIKGPMTIAEMFPFLKGTEFESSLDAAFESSIKYEAYLFTGDRHARINYNASDSHLITRCLIKEDFPSLKSTIFASGVDAAFASHRTNEAYLFKGDSYACINFAPGTTDDYSIGGAVKPILPYWPSLRKILPRKNHGQHTKPA